MAETKAVTRADTLPESKVDPAQTLIATKSLLAYIKKSAEDETTKTGKRNLLAADDEDAAGGSGVAETPIWLTVSTKRHIIDSSRLQPNTIRVPHALNKDDDTTICLITADPQRAYKDIVASEAFPAPLRKRITRVIDVAHLGKKFKSYEAQRKLFAEHDLFLGDDRIINRLPKVLGKTFYKTTVKRAIPVVLAKRRPRGADGKRAKAPKKKGPAKTVDGDATLSAEDQAAAVAEAMASARTPEQIAAEIEKAIGSAVVHLSASESTSVKVGLAGWPAAHVAANVEAVAREVVGKYVPQKWNSVKSIFLKGPRTMALPIWQTDELWLEGSKDVLKTGSSELKAYEERQAAKREKANVGKKRKALTDGTGAAAKEEATEEKAAPATKKGKAAAAPAKEAAARPAKKAKQAPESNDSSLDKQIAASKEKLRKQKAAAKKAMGI
ncbi:proteasome-interacting protein cic1 [Sporothrix curviconia]|uniref:Proteasome-interacting protein cic1 n=1 Tax=Sporothrix curviconia TaxID=1260050 RepID=A0ABP0C1X3_9PEZI